MTTPQGWRERFDLIPHGAPLSAWGDYVSVVNAKAFIAKELTQAEARGALREVEQANEVVRSAYQIALRRGLDTNWSAFTARAHGELKRQHAIMYPNSPITNLRTINMKTITIDFPGLSLLDVYNKNKDIWYTSNSWFKDKSFATDKVPAGKWEVSLEPVEDSTDKTWAQQQGLIPSKAYVPPAAVLAYAICEYHKQKDKHALSDLWLRTSSLDADGHHVSVGVNSGCVSVYYYWGSGRGSSLGLASAWKVDAGDLDDSTLLDSSELDALKERVLKIEKWIASGI